MFAWPKRTLARRLAALRGALQRDESAAPRSAASKDMDKRARPLAPVQSTRTPVKKINGHPTALPCPMRAGATSLAPMRRDGGPSQVTIAMWMSWVCVRLALAPCVCAAALSLLDAVERNGRQIVAAPHTVAATCLRIAYKWTNDCPRNSFFSALDKEYRSALAHTHDPYSADAPAKDDLYARHRFWLRRDLALLDAIGWRVCAIVNRGGALAPTGEAAVGACRLLTNPNARIITHEWRKHCRITLPHHSDVPTNSRPSLLFDSSSSLSSFSSPESSSALSSPKRRRRPARATPITTATTRRRKSLQDEPTQPCGCARCTKARRRERIQHERQMTCDADLTSLAHQQRQTNTRQSARKSHGARNRRES